jgi:hypothetical protein
VRPAIEPKEFPKFILITIYGDNIQPEERVLSFETYPLGDIPQVSKVRGL